MEVRLKRRNKPSSEACLQALQGLAGGIWDRRNRDLEVAQLFDRIPVG